MFYIPAENIKALDTSITENLTPVPQTMKIHLLVTDRKLEIKYRYLSCYCGDKRGKCDCHSPLKIKKIILFRFEIKQTEKEFKKSIKPTAKITPKLK